MSFKLLAISLALTARWVSVSAMDQDTEEDAEATRARHEQVENDLRVNIELEKERLDDRRERTRKNLDPEDPMSLRYKIDRETNMKIEKMETTTVQYIEDVRQIYEQLELDMNAQREQINEDEHLDEKQRLELKKLLDDIRESNTKAMNSLRSRIDRDTKMRVEKIEAQRLKQLEDVIYSYAITNADRQETVRRSEQVRQTKRIDESDQAGQTDRADQAGQAQPSNQADQTGQAQQPDQTDQVDHTQQAHQTDQAEQSDEEHQVGETDQTREGQQSAQADGQFSSPRRWGDEQGRFNRCAVL